ncbi:MULTISPECIES: tetratricopeptide repeat protein [unclassified Pseudomonas]|uniref:tetratricopeptide repeat protein n=1 Tax=unclassified Pseudomonas TaxID=196821 RepID=UPI0035C0CAFD
MKFRGKSFAQSPTHPSSTQFSLKVALWLLDSPRLGSKPSVKHLAGRLLKHPARQGVVVAQSRLGQMLCRECGNARDRRIGHELLRQAARAGDRRAQLEYGRLCQAQAPEQARHWLELAAEQGSQEARRLLVQGRLAGQARAKTE